MVSEGGVRVPGASYIGGGEWKDDAVVLVRHERELFADKKKEKRRKRAIGSFLSSDFRTEQTPAYANSLTRTSVDYHLDQLGGLWPDRASLRWGKVRTDDLEVELFLARGRFSLNAKS